MVRRLTAREKLRMKKVCVNVSGLFVEMCLLAMIFFGVLKNLRHTLAQLGRALREYQTAFQKEGTQLVDDRGSSCDQAIRAHDAAPANPAGHLS
jgi:hypothetical protein